MFGLQLLCSNMVATTDTEVVPDGMFPITVTSLDDCTFRTNQDNKIYGKSLTSSRTISHVCASSS